MADIVVFHHAQGLTPGVVDFADGRRCAGHTVRTPDLFEGRTFDTVDQGVGHAHQIGFDTVIDRGAQAVDGLQAGLIYAGFSLRVLLALALALTLTSRPGARAALLFHARVSVYEFGTSWPDDLAVQVHALQADPFFVNGGDLDAVRALVDQAADAELFLYPGDLHLFADSSLPSFDAAASALLTQRVLTFLARTR